MLGTGERRFLMTKLIFGLLVTAALSWAGPELERAQQLFQNTQYEEAVRLLNSAPTRDAATLALLGKCYYMQADFKKATGYLEQAVAQAPSFSEYHHWLGRAWGRRAETSSFLTAPGFASKARESFEKAVALNPRNLEAINDLFEYYLEAPGFLGGGMDKANALSERIQQLDRAEYFYAKARLAEKRKEFQTAEQQLRRAMETAPRQVGRILDLAKFLAQRGRFQESEAAFQKARQVAPDSPKVLFEQASTYVQSGRNLEIARELLNRYLNASLTPNDPPRSEAQALLKRISGSS
jgi:tetratricopeptide (TPR) repeat protein